MTEREAYRRGLARGIWLYESEDRTLEDITAETTERVKHYWPMDNNELSQQIQHDLIKDKENPAISR